MRTLVIYVIGLGLALWLGGSMALYMFVQYLFKIERAVAVNAAPMMFFIFERYQLMIAAILLAATIVWRLYSCSRPKKLLLACLMVASLLAITQFGIISPKMNELHLTGQSSNMEFKKLHGYSMVVYVGTTVMTLLAGGAFITSLIRDQSFSRISGESAPAKSTPPGA